MSAVMFTLQHGVFISASTLFAATHVHAPRNPALYQFPQSGLGNVMSSKFLPSLELKLGCSGEEPGYSQEVSQERGECEQESGGASRCQSQQLGKASWQCQQPGELAMAGDNITIIIISKV